MKQIIYQFCDGTKQTIEVDDNFANEIDILDKQDKKSERRETRRHTSLDYLLDQGIEFANNEISLDEKLGLKDLQQKVQLAITQLNESQQKLVQAVFFEEKTLTEVAIEKGVSKSAITQQMQVIYKKLREILKNFRILP